MLVTEANTTACTGMDVLISTLLEEKTEVLFGSHGGAVQFLYHPFNHHNTIRQVILEHEQATIHAADGYARVSGKVGVAFLPSGSSLTNGITGILTAQMDSAPLVVIILTDNAGTDVSGMTTPVTKYHIRITSEEDIHNGLSTAFKIAGEGRKGTVVVELNHDLLAKSAAPSIPRNSWAEPKEKEAQQSYKMIKKMNEEISKAKKPVLLIGGGVISAEASSLVRKVADAANIPVVSTLMGLGAFPADHPHFLGMVGMHGTFAANKAVHRADLLICLGIRFSDRVTGKISGFSPKSTKIQVDIDAAEINKNVTVDLPVVGDVNSVLLKLLPLLKAGDTAEWLKETGTWQRIAPRFSDSNSELKPQQVIQLLDRYSSEQAIVSTDVGQHQIWTAHNYKFNYPRTFVTSGGLGTMGFGLPAAIGAAAGANGGEVILVSGDGSFQMNYQELATIANSQLPIKIVILKNGYLGMVRQWQEMFYKGRYSSVKISSPNFVTLAKAYGLQVGSARNLTEAETLIQQAFSHNLPTVMEFDVTEEENVFPIVPPGSSNTETILN